jgi:integrase
MSELLLDRAGRRRSPATMPGFHAGRSPRNKGLRYPADPPKVEEIIAVMRVAGDGVHGRRLRGLIVILWRAGLRIQEALALAEADLDYRRGALLVRRGKRPVSAGVSLLTNSGTPTRSRWRAKVCR